VPEKSYEMSSGLVQVLSPLVFSSGIHYSRFSIEESVIGIIIITSTLSISFLLKNTLNELNLLIINIPTEKMEI